MSKLIFARKASVAPIVMPKNTLKCYAQEYIKMFFLIILNQSSLFAATLTSKMHLTESNKWPNASSRWTVHLFSFTNRKLQGIDSHLYGNGWVWTVFLVHLSEHFPRESTAESWARTGISRGENDGESWSSHERSLKAEDLGRTQPNLSTITGTKTHTESQNL